MKKVQCAGPGCSTRRIHYESDKPRGIIYIDVPDEYAKGDAHTNSIESVWAVLKRGVHGTFHHVSTKHLDRYVDEFTFRLNAGKVSRHTTERLDSFVSLVAGKRITYKRLTKGSTWFDDGSLQVAEIV